MTLELHATPAEVMRAVEALQRLGQAALIPDQALFGLALALEECASNIVNHALQRDAHRTFHASLEQAGNEFRIELRDGGPAFDPTQAAPKGSPADDAPGGWGLELVRRHVDEIRYTRDGGENVLRLMKRFNLRQTTPDLHQLIPQTNIMPLDIQIQQNVGGGKDSAITVKLGGSLDTATAPELERQLGPVLAGPVKDIVFDLAQLRFISSAGLRVFSTTRKTLKERGGQASFMNMQPQIQEVFEIIKALPGVKVFKDVAELDRYLAARQRAHEDNK
jgi:anti-sigma B factor antagonist